MLYNKYLDWFILVSDLGSFSKAAKHLYVSSTAIMNQMDELERQLDLKLLHRNNQGVTLTKVGKLIYADAKNIIRFSDNTLKNAKLSSETETQTIHVGTSFLNPHQLIHNLWSKYNEEYPSYKLNIIPFETNTSYRNTIIDYVGEKFDIIIGGLDESSLYKDYEIHPIEFKRFNCLVSPDHPLAEKNFISLSDLNHYTIMLANPGESKQHDLFRNEIKRRNLDIQFKDIPFYYGMDMFNHIQNTKEVLIAYEGWDNTHPSLKAVPLSLIYNLEIPFGIISLKSASQKVKDFINIIMPS